MIKRYKEKQGEIKKKVKPKKVKNKKRKKGRDEDEHILQCLGSFHHLIALDINGSGIQSLDGKMKENSGR